MRDGVIDLALSMLVIFAVIIGVIVAYDSRFKELDNKIANCNCTINMNGSNMSVEDAFEAVLEGLSKDQADEVQIMINNSLRGD